MSAIWYAVPFGCLAVALALAWLVTGWSIDRPEREHKHARPRPGRRDIRAAARAADDDTVTLYRQMNADLPPLSEAPWLPVRVELEERPQAFFDAHDLAAIEAAEDLPPNARAGTWTPVRDEHRVSGWATEDAPTELVPLPPPDLTPAEVDAIKARFLAAVAKGGRPAVLSASLPEVVPCADTPYRCDGFDPADWPGDVPPAVHEVAAIVARNTADDPAEAPTVISDAEFAAALAHVTGVHGEIPPPLQAVVDAGGRFALHPARALLALPHLDASPWASEVGSFAAWAGVGGYE